MAATLYERKFRRGNWIYSERCSAPMAMPRATIDTTMIMVFRKGLDVIADRACLTPKVRRSHFSDDGHRYRKSASSSSGKRPRGADEHEPSSDMVIDRGRFCW